MAAVWLPAWTADRTASLRYPAESAARLMERHLEFYVGFEDLPGWQAALFHWLYGKEEAAFAAAAQAYRDVLDHFHARPGAATEWALTNTRARLALVLLEAGDGPGAEAVLSEFGPTPEDGVIEDTIRFAYALAPRPISPAELQAGLRLMPVGWATDTLARRLAERGGEAWLVSRIDARQSARAQERQGVTLLLSALTAGLMVAGLVALARQVPRERRQRPSAESPWGFEEGTAVLVRAGMVGVSLYLVLGLFDSWFHPHLLAQWSTLLASLPMVWMMRRHLLRPRGQAFVQVFGLNPARVGIGRVLGLTLVLVLIERSGALFISWSLWNMDVQPHWAEGLAERWIWGPWQSTLVSSVNTVVWAPVFEEIGFRGLLFLTLRSRFGFATAALLSAGVFALLHPYSLAALLAVLWSGLVWAWAFERFRTLLPGILAHALGNLLAVSAILLFYR